MEYIKLFSDITLSDSSLVGGKNASLGFMTQNAQSLDIRVPLGFAITTEAYTCFLRENNLIPLIADLLEELDVHDISMLQRAGSHTRSLIHTAILPAPIGTEIIRAYKQLSEQYDQTWCDVAVRSSATAEDLPDASFAGQQETFLAIQGPEALLEACKKCIASLFTDRAIAYRIEHNIDHLNTTLSIGVQKMVRSDGASAGIAFSLETETGSPHFVTISSSYGLGELIAQGTIIPDEFYVHKDRLKKGFKPIVRKMLGSKKEKLIYAQHATKSINVPLEDSNAFSLTDRQILEVAQAVITLEEAYSKKNWVPLDVEWAYDSVDGKLYILQARPETVHSIKSRTTSMTCYVLAPIDSPTLLARGQSVGQKIAHGKAHIIQDMASAHTFKEGDILVTAMTDPDWVPLLKKAAGIITDQGGRTCHAAIVSRELGIPALVGTHNATQTIINGQEVTLDCSQGSEGYVYQGTIPFKKHTVNTDPNYNGSTQLMINMADPSKACEYSFLPADGVGLARLEFIIAQMIKIHPIALTQPEMIPDTSVHSKIKELTAGYANPEAFFIDVLAQSIGLIAGAFYPRPVIVRLTDLKSNEYKQLIGGKYCEPDEENPMLGFRGAVRYISSSYAAAFSLECKAIKKAREEMGFDNIILMVPFVRTVPEAEQVRTILAHNGLIQGENNLKLYMMVEIPSNVLLLEQFAKIFDGFSIGSNDLTQLTLGVDRDSGHLTKQFDERDPAMEKMFLMAIAAARRAHRPIGICGQAPSDFPQLAALLIEAGISSVSLSPDALLPFMHTLEPVSPAFVEHSALFF